MTDTKEFPPIIPGHCDGLGCGEKICWCNESVHMMEEYQRKYNKQWDHSSSECKIFEDGWRVGNKYIDELNKLHRKNASFEMFIQKWNAECFVWLKNHMFDVTDTHVEVIPMSIVRGKYSLLHRDKDKIINIAIQSMIDKEKRETK